MRLYPPYIWLLKHTCLHFPAASCGEVHFGVKFFASHISEATRRPPAELKETRPEIEWRSVAGIGNVLRHEYHTISDKIVWDVVQGDLPLLKTAIMALAARLE